MKSFAFSSEELPKGFDDRARVSAWRDFMAEAYAHDMSVSGLPDRPFAQRLRGTRFDDSTMPVEVLRASGTMDRMFWRAQGKAAPRADNLVLCVSRQTTPLSLVQVGREALCDSQTATLFSCIEDGELRAKHPHDFWSVAIDRARLRELIDGVEDLVARPLSVDGPALRHLQRYLEIIPPAADAKDDPALLAHIGTTLTDLVALALGAKRDAAEIAGMRGLRAARLHEIIKQIRARFADPAFSPHDLARRLGVTERYIQDLLYQSGSSFTQRVLELRLQRARAMLTEARHAGLKVGEIAVASGFNEIPYFNRCFRRRFGATPSQLRGRGAPMEPLGAKP